MALQGCLYLRPRDQITAKAAASISTLPHLPSHPSEATLSDLSQTTLEFTLTYLHTRYYIANALELPSASSDVLLNLPPNGSPTSQESDMYNDTEVQEPSADDVVSLLVDRQAALRSSVQNKQRLLARLSTSR